MTAPIPIVTSIAAFAQSSQVWLVDVWGVVHNGVRPFLQATAACEKFRREGGIVILVTNAPRPKESVGQQLDRIGVPRNSYDAIVTSGDTARALIAALSGRRVFHLGPERDLALFDGSGAILSDAGSAEAIVCTGLDDDETETAASYAGLLRAARARNLEMVCANPDLTVERGGRIIPCAGAVAHAYEAIGGRVAYAGKPYLPIYETAFAVAAGIAGRSIGTGHYLAIGDGLRTDILGAHNAGLRSVYIASGVHAGAAGLDRTLLADLFPAGAPLPVAAMPALAW